jgi:hypothetical protein
MCASPMDVVQRNDEVPTAPPPLPGDLSMTVSAPLRDGSVGGALRGPEPMAAFMCASPIDVLDLNILLPGDRALPMSVDHALALVS